MSSIFTSIRSALSNYSPVQPPPFQSSVVHLSTRDRESLVHDVALELNHEDVESSLVDVERTLAECRTSLEEFEKKERFLSLRVGRYRELMERREMRMSEMSDKMQQSHPNNSEDGASEGGDDGANDLENTNADNLSEQLDLLQTKHAADRESLRTVEEMHKDIIAQTETFRRRIEELEEKQQDLVAKRDECRDFLIAAAECT